MRGLIGILLAVSCGFAQDSLQRAEELYNKTDYKESLELLRTVPPRDVFPTQASVYNLIGRDYFMLGEYKKATEAFQKAFALEPSNSVHAHWLGRSFGRRASTNLKYQPIHCGRYIRSVL